MTIAYHGSANLFSRFDAAHLLEGAAKCKFGVGAYLTSRYASAAHYAGASGRPEKYRQSEAFREELERTRGLYIVEDQTTFHKKSPDTWGVKPSEDGKEFVGPNLMGRLLMELRDNGRLDYSLPEDVLSFQDLTRP